MRTGCNRTMPHSGLGWGSHLDCLENLGTVHGLKSAGI